MNILLIAFKGNNNTSFQLVNQIAEDYILLTNSFQGVEKDISFISSDYDTVYMFGVDKNLKNKVRIEACASYNNETICTNFDIPDLEIRLQSMDISFTTSDKPTHYLCNAAYYHMLKKNPNTVFIHIPSLKGMSSELMDKLIKVFYKKC